MDHTYLRYECADAFSLACSSGSSRAPVSNGALQCFQFTNTHNNNKNNKTSDDSLIFTTAGSQVIGFSLKQGLPVLKVAHREPTNIGTGRALNSEEVVCIDIVSDPTTSSTTSSSTTKKIATGWVDGTVRVFDIDPSKDVANKGGLVHSLLYNNNNNDDDDDEFLTQEPLVLNGHATCVRSLRFHSDATKLASGGVDGSVVLWDLVAETGLFRLLGHRGAITDISFLTLYEETENATANNKSPFILFDGLITTSLDNFVKVWDLRGQCCTQTIVAHQGEVFCGALLQQLNQAEQRCRLVTGSADGQVRVWNVKAPGRNRNNEEDNDGDNTNSLVVITEENIEFKKEDNGLHNDICHYMGSLSAPPNVAQSAEKVTTVQFHPNQKFVGVLHNNSKNVDIYKIRTTSEAQQKRQRRLRRRREKKHQKKNKSKNGGDATEEGEEKGRRKRGILDDDDDEDAGEDEDGGKQQEPLDESLVDVEAIKASDEFEYFGTCRASHKVRAFQFLQEKGVKVVCTLSTNAIETLSLVKRMTKGTEYVMVSEKMSLLDMYGHPTGIRAVSLSSDDALACTVSKNVTKLWNVNKRSCVQSVNHGVSCYGLCVSFLPGNTHVIIGTREGNLMILDVASSDVVYIEEGAHDGAIWSVDVRRPGTERETIALVTGSGDKTVKFWDIESQEDGNPMVVLTRSLQMTDDVVSVRYSHSTDPTKRMVFVSALDSTIKVFFDDTLKFFLSLYGHQLPALAVDASDDDTILASSGADKAIKIWGLDFGDTHRTLYGHQDSVTDLRFVRRTHNFFTASKDRTIRYWDGDRFEQILILHGHSAEVNSLSVSRTGAFVLSAGMDRQIRVWERTKDIVFLEEERERELEKMFDKVDSSREEGGTAAVLQKKGADENEDDDAEDMPQSEAAVKKSVLSVSAGDRIMEALERADQEQKDISAFKRSEGNNKQRMPNPLLFGLEPALYVLWVLRSVKSAELEQSLLVLPLTHIERLVYYLILLLRQGRSVELCAKVSVFVTKAHQRQIVASKSLSIPLRELRRLLRLRLTESRDAVGFNLAALRAIARTVAERKASFMPPEAPSQNIWEGLGLGSDIAAALEKKGR